MKRSLFLAIAAIALVAMPRVSQAQLGLVKPFSLGIAGGATQPMSDLSNTNSMGYNATAAMEIKLPFIPLGLRVDGAYNQLGQKNNGPKLHVMSATGNAFWQLPSVVAAPYVIAGAGLYIPAVEALGTTTTSNHFGWNAGAGIKLPYHAFAEARYNRISVNGGSLAYVPVTLGIMF